MIRLVKRGKLSNFCANIYLLISAWAFWVTTVNTNNKLYVAAAGCLITFFLSFHLIVEPGFVKKNSSIISIIIAFGIALANLGFFTNIIYSSKIQAVASAIGINCNVLAGIITAAGIIISLYFLLFIVCAVKYYLIENRNGNDEITVIARISRTDIIWCLVTAIVVITICSKSSPLYPLNDWVDSNCFFTVGKAMLSGKVPYRDLFEQKGPLIYMLHAVAAWISYQSFIGIYIFEIAVCTVFLFLSRALMLLYSRKASIIWIPVIAAIIYSSKSFCHGDSVEEFCLPLLMASIYIALKSLRSGLKISKMESIIIGITSGAVLWTKYSLLGIYAGMLIAFIIIRINEKRVREVFEFVGWVIAGLIIITIPIVIYFIANSALSDLFTVYFYDNIFMYTNTDTGKSAGGVFYNLLHGFYNMYNNNLFADLFILMGLWKTAASKRRNETLMLILSFAGAFLLIYCGGHHFGYYSFALNVYVTFGVIAVAEFVSGTSMYDKLGEKTPAIGTAAICCLLTAFLYLRSDNTYLIGVSKDELPQYQFAEIINQYSNATLYNYGFLDGGFYTTTGIIPDTKFFCELNIEYDEMLKSQEQYIEDALTDFVVTRDCILDTENYKLVATSAYYFEERVRTYYLYQRTDI